MIEVLLVSVLIMDNGQYVPGHRMGMPPRKMESYEDCLEKIQNVPELTFPKGVKGMNFGCLVQIREGDVT